MSTKLRELRNKSGLQRSYVAKELNINADYLNRIERGIGTLNEARARQMSRLYRCSIDEIKNAWRELNEERKVR